MLENLNTFDKYVISNDDFELTFFTYQDWLISGYIKVLRNFRIDGTKHLGINNLNREFKGLLYTSIKGYNTNYGGDYFAPIQISVKTDFIKSDIANFQVYA